MNSLIADTESGLRFAVFIGAFCVLAMAELLFPRRRLAYSKSVRWANNLAISVFNTILVGIVVPLAGVGAALLAQEQQWGLFFLISDRVYFPHWLSVLVFLFVFDLVIYTQHRLFHVVPVLWRFHRMHHTDLDYDLTTGIRFHPISILISSLIKIALVLFCGASVTAILLAEVLLSTTSLFNHSNLKLGDRLDTVLRKVIVTPDMHRIHHSTDRFEHNHNFGFNFPWWDRMFGSYLDKPKSSQEELDIGISGLQGNESMHFLPLLWQPFQNPDEVRPD